MREFINTLTIGPAPEFVKPASGAIPQRPADPSTFLFE